MDANALKITVDDGVQLLMDACDTDSVYWSTLAAGRDTEEAESSGYLAGYRDALSAIQRIVNHGDLSILRYYLASVRDEMHELQTEIEDIDPGPHFWDPTN